MPAKIQIYLQNKSLAQIKAQLKGSKSYNFFMEKYIKITGSGTKTRGKKILRQYCKTNKISIEELKEWGLESYTLADYLNNKKGINGQRLKYKLIDANLKKDICDNCGITNFYNNRPLTLQLDHRVRLTLLLTLLLFYDL